MRTNDIIDTIRERLGDRWIPAIYADRVRPLRTRAVELNAPARENNPVVLHTLLGVELKVGRRRIACPDLGTARYLSVFAALGCNRVAVPYDITVVPVIADLLESSWHETFRALSELSAGLSPQNAGRLRSRVVREIREGVGLTGAGESMPLFNADTRQRGGV